MKINFYPEYDNPKFEKAAEEYSLIWIQEGKKIIKVIEKVSKLKFKEKIINAIIYGEVSYSRPLMLQYNLTIQDKKGTLVHELCHRVLSGQGYDLKFKNKITNKNYDLESHKIIDLILYDIWIKLYGEKFAKEEIRLEISLWTRKEVSPYKIAWDWALKMTKEERAKEFNKYFIK